MTSVPWRNFRKHLTSRSNIRSTFFDEPDDADSDFDVENNVPRQLFHDNRPFLAQGTSASIEPQNVNNPYERAKRKFMPPKKTHEELFTNCVEKGELFDKLNEIEKDDEIYVSSGSDESVRRLRIQNFEECCFSPAMVQTISQMCNFRCPTQIQKVVIPIILKTSYDIVAHSNTGSGKTAAFLLPIVQELHLAKNHSKNSPYCIILSPTKELTEQLFQEAGKFVRKMGVTIARSYGGMLMGKTLSEIERGCDILVVTLGRLKHHVEDEHIYLNKLRYFVMNEADKLIMERKFVTTIEACIKHYFPPTTRLLLFSATFNEDVLRVVNELLKEKYVIVKKKTIKEIFGLEKIFVTDDLLLEIFQFCNFHTVGTNFCLVNRRWNYVGQWHCQNRPHRIPYMILNVKEECYPRIAEKICWEKNAYLRSWHRNATEEKLVNVPSEIPKNYEKIRALCIQFPYDCNVLRRTDKKLVDLITACSARMRFCRIQIFLNDVKAPPASFYKHIMFNELFLASIAQLNEIHMVFEAVSNWNFSEHDYNLYIWLTDWLLGSINLQEKEDRKLYLINFDPLNFVWYLDTVKEKFFQTVQRMPIFNVVFLMKRGSTQIYEKIKIKNIKTGQILYSYFNQINGDKYVWISLCNSMEETEKNFEFSKMEEMSIIQWNIYPGKDYIQMREEMEENKDKLKPGFIDLLK